MATKRALSSAPLVYDNLLGGILNKADLDVMRNYSPAGGYRYKEQYLERYGLED